MGLFNFASIASLESKIQDLEEKIVELEHDKSKLQMQIKEYISIETADHQVDFFAMNAFSIERLADKPDTVIGYKLDEISEWHISCSFEVHQRLCEEFKEYIIEKKLRGG